uniref:Uncharacterized protein n=1 Tax=Oncorhynchus mykiss TaxID=8022 RepID=A0A8K9UWV2_ONCMY
MLSFCSTTTGLAAVFIFSTSPSRSSLTRGSFHHVPPCWTCWGSLACGCGMGHCPGTCPPCDQSLSDPRAVVVSCQASWRQGNHCSEKILTYYLFLSASYFSYFSAH